MKSSCVELEAGLDPSKQTGEEAQQRVRSRLTFIYIYIYGEVAQR